MILPICAYGSAELRKKCEPVGEITPELLKLADDMLETMYNANGVGLAAPQVGRNIRLVVIDLGKDEEERKPIILFNPVAVPEEGDNPEVSEEEGCLSVPDVWAQVSRPGKVRLAYTSEKGEAVDLRGVDGKLARCAQHEQDHLNGILFVDKISTTDRVMNAAKLKRMAKKNK